MTPRHIQLTLSYETKAIFPYKLQKQNKTGMGVSNPLSFKELFRSVFPIYPKQANEISARAFLLLFLFCN